MENSKLTGILRTFSRKEMTDFGQFLASDFFCVNKRIRLLYKILYKEHPYLNVEVLHKEEIHRKIFPGQRYNDKRIRYLLTDFTRLAEEFLALIAFDADKQHKKVLLSRELAKRDCEKAYLQHYHEILEPQSTVRDAAFYFNRYQAKLDNLTFEIPRQKRKAQLTVTAVTGNLDIFYISRKLQLCCEIYNVQNVMKVDHKVLLLDELLEFLLRNPMDEVPVVSIYYRILMTLLYSENEEHFIKLQDLLIRHADKITRSELRDMYQYVLNYCIKRINLGNSNYQQVLFDTYKTILSNEVILVDHFLSQWDFKNICTISFRLREFEWAGQFIEKYKQFIRSSEKENAYAYNKAYLLFHLGAFSKSLHLLQKVNFTDLYYQIDTRAMILKIYYEMEDHEALRYHLQAFKIFLTRNKVVSAYQRTIYSNLVKFTWKLVRNQSKQAKLQVLHQEISETRSTADLHWLLKKTSELVNTNLVN